MNTKKLLSLLIAVMLLATMVVGCGSDDTNTSAEPTKASESDSSSNESAGDEAPYEMRWLTDFPADKNSQIYMNSIAQLEAATNVVLEIESAPAANYGERIQLTLASGDLPDAIIFNSTEDPLIKSSVEAGTFIAVNEYLENAPNIQKYISPIGLDALKYMGDDQIYGIPRHTFVRADGFAVRTDWLDVVGIEVEPGQPITLDQFTQIVEKFSTGDPDGNGKDDTFGIAVMSSDSGDMFDIYAKDTFAAIVQGVFGCVGWQAYDGEDYDYMNLVFSQKSDNFKNCLAYLQDLYTQGYVDPDWPVLKKTQVQENFDQGKYGMDVRFPLHVPSIVIPNLQKVNPDADATWISGIINPETGDVTGTSFSNTCWGTWQITTGSEKPEKVIEVFDALLADGFYHEQMVYGGEGMGYTLEGDKKVPTELYANVDEGTGNSSRILRRYGDPAVYLSLNSTEEENVMYGEWLDEAVANATLSESLGYMPEVATSPLFLDYHKEMNEVITRIIIGELEVDAYDEALAGWYENGGEEYVVEMNEYIKSLK